MKPVYVFWGKVIGGAKRGSGLGFPTANIRLHKKIPEGIYAAQVRLSNKTYLAATFVGGAKTFEENDYKAESFVLDFHGYLYGAWISVRLYKKLRDNKKFVSQEALTTQMRSDVAKVREYFTLQRPH